MRKSQTEQMMNFDADEAWKLENTFSVSASLLDTVRKLAAPFDQDYFDVFHVTSGPWAARKQRWVTDIGIRGEVGRSTDAAESDDADITSVFDPVLCEVAYKWYCPKGGSILDPYAGGSTRGLVAAYLGYDYTGIDIRQEQVDANRKQYKAVKALHDKVFAEEIAAGTCEPMKTPTWIFGDSAEMEALLPAGKKYDLLFTCPPYYDLEVYSTKQSDNSTAQTYEEFLESYGGILRLAVDRLYNDRFAVITVGDVRSDKTGAYRLFPEDTSILLTRKLKLVPHNKAILCTPIWNHAVRAEAAFPSNRRLAHTYQEVKIFWKGAAKKNAVKEAWGEFVP
jgi:hypothetical protein